MSLQEVVAATLNEGVGGKIEEEMRKNLRTLHYNYVKRGYHFLCRRAEQFSYFLLELVFASFITCCLDKLIALAL
jgi:hypothetical protein